MRLALFLGITLGCIFTALIPEMVMWKLYHVIHPVEFWEKFATMVVFWFGGGSLCVLAAVISAVVWGVLVKEL